ncbi:MAG: hypothetical protein A2Y40_07140 [Candidatus Margulisbacteria bacterium GWF2_35_9]|nr:MAG: hypothetical protein A2Y40_07140 [Candidatus Margulisbacteria bacterium GWF2_35_9]
MLKYLTIHGHFYQPPRENPYLEKIEVQQSAYPYHDWNERITDECYRPNTCSRVLNSDGKIMDIVNNYEYLSFNIGPTLIQWLERYDQETYFKIIEADKASCKRNNGHGNAIAQVYNHIIMPLASQRDKVTQIRWGIDDFKRHFGRDPEGMWLAETAINLDTVKALVENGIKYTILSPFQAEKVRNLFSNVWMDVSSGSIDPTQPYRIYTNDDRTEYLDVFFYDAPISTAISFEHLLRDANSLMERLAHAAGPNEGRPMLIHVSTDGESYGHHEPFGDMCLAYFFKYLAPQHGFKILNYAQFLEMYPPVSEVVLKDGVNNEGTAWSCSHGVGRWKEDCGCSTGAQANWNQRWRAPLRQGLDALRDKLWEIYNREATEYFKDPEKARNDYYLLISGDITADQFFKKHMKKNINPDENKLYKLLEIQRFSQLMFTSCGWFFADISGIETVQIIKYANIAIKYATSFTDEDMESMFQTYMQEAHSNVGPEYNGDVIYNKWIKPYELDVYKAVNQFMVEGELFHELKSRMIYLYQITPGQIIKHSADNVRYIFVNIQTKHQLTLDTKDLSAVIIAEQDDLRTVITENGEVNLTVFYEKFKLQKDSVKKLEMLTETFPIQKTMKDLNFEESATIMDFLWEKKYSNLIHSLDNIFKTFEGLIKSTITMGGYLPPEIKSILEMVFSAKYYESIQKMDINKDEDVSEVKEVIDMSRKLMLVINKDRAKKYLEKMLVYLMEKIKDPFMKDDVENIIKFLSILDKLDIKINKTVAENIAFSFYQEIKADSDKIKHKKLLLKMIEMLNIGIT